jgi:prepilin-type N-terminal cleavage/methylation domain-containing protein
MIQQSKFKNSSGFSLIEISVALIIISLLLGGILKGQQLINIAKEKQLESDFINLPRMIYSYQDKFKALPGDDIKAVSRFSGTGHSVQNGDGENMITGDWFEFNPTKDSSIIWQHLRLAGLMDGETNMSSPNYFPKNSLGKAIEIQSAPSIASESPILDGHGNALKGTYIICSRGISGELVMSLDIHLDDGNPSSGSVLATEDNGTFTIAASPATIGTNTMSDISRDNLYTVCMGV